MPNSDTEENWIADTLARKRKQIEQEIAAFKAEKEKDYIAFEHMLRSGDRGTELRGQDTYRSSLGATDVLDKRREDPVYYGGEQVSNISPKGKSDAIARGSTPIAIDGRDELPSTRDAPTHTRERRSEFHRSRSDSFVPTTDHERESEFHGLFTPSYLPLLDSSPHDRRNAPTTSSKPAPSTPPRDSKSNLSSSATFFASRTSSPPPHRRQLSSSAPRQRTVDPRRSASRSDTSEASLRSSLRDPRTPRSPKHVLFNIDNVVVSPSTSPLLHRSNLASQPRGLDIAAAINAEMGGAATAAKGKNKELVVEKWNTKSGISTQLKARAKQPIETPLFRSSGGKFSSLFADGHATAFEPEVYDNDDLFAFDEDVGLREDLADGDKVDDMASDEEAETGAGKDDMTVGSPRAGSLPIEIKWPGRRDR